jgi:hypothetical protein
MTPTSRPPQCRSAKLGKEPLRRPSAGKRTRAQKRQFLEPGSTQEVPRETVSFKADFILASRLRALTNRSDFIRLAVLKALHRVCPTCHGTGLIDKERLDGGRP